MGSLEPMVVDNRLHYTFLCFIHKLLMALTSLPYVYSIIISSSSNFFNELYIGFAATATLGTGASATAVIGSGAVASVSGIYTNSERMRFALNNSLNE